MSIAHRLFAFLTLILLICSHTLSSHGLRTPPYREARPVAYSGTGESGPDFGPDVGTCEWLHTCGRITK